MADTRPARAVALLAGNGAIALLLGERALRGLATWPPDTQATNGAFLLVSMFGVYCAYRMLDFAGNDAPGARRASEVHETLSMLTFAAPALLLVWALFYPTARSQSPGPIPGESAAPRAPP